MNSITGNQSVDTTQEKQPDYLAQYRIQYDTYLQKQPGIVRALHWTLLIFALFCIVLAGAMFFIALYYTYDWITTGDLTYLGVAWVNFGLSMSFVVFPWGLDAMLLRAFPSYPMVSWYKPKKPIKFFTGFGAFWAGLGIMCAGAPGAARMFELAGQALQKF
jgi:hypothetical protein